LPDSSVRRAVEVRGLGLETGDDERGASLVNEDAIHLVHDCEMKVAQDETFAYPLHVVAQIVETDLIVRAIGDIAVVRMLALRSAQVVLDAPYGESTPFVDGTFPVSVTAREVVVGGD